MDKLDQIYLLMLILSIPYGHFIKNLGHPLQKKIFCFVAGLLIVSSLVGYPGILHSFITILVNYALIKICGPRYCHYISFVFVFGYLLFYRCCGYIGFPIPPKHSNAVQLLVTLRMINIAFEVHDNEVLRLSGEKSPLKLRLKRDFSANLFDYFVYGYCYIGLMTGPFYTYQTFQDMIYQDGTKISSVRPAIRNLKLLPVVAIIYLCLKSLYPKEYVENENFSEHGFIYTTFIIGVWYTWIRYRYYIGWLLAESMCMTAGLGAYPFECVAKPGGGPVESIPEDFIPEESAKNHNGDTHDFNTIHNVDILKLEVSCVSIRQGMKLWNLTVQWWLSTYVYKRILPFKSPTIRMVLLFFISAYWHGIHAGYYLSFAIVILMMIGETMIHNAVKPHLITDRQKYWWDWMRWFFFYRSMEFTAQSFIFLEFGTIFKVWRSVYFSGLFWNVFLMILSFLIPRKKVKQV